MKTLEQLASDWLSAKETENDAVADRRSIEDQMAIMLKVDHTKDSSKSHHVGYFECKVTTRLTRKIDSELVQEIAQEYQLQDQLSILFRWKPDLNLNAWKSAPDEYKNVLIKAITTTASRPSFSISLKSKD